MMRALGCLIPSSTIFAFAAPSVALAAVADEKLEQARKYFEAGRQAYEAGLFIGAASAFEEAYRLAPRPQIIFSLAQAHRRQYFVDQDPVHLRRAIGYLRQYIAEVKQGGRRADAVQFLEDLEPLLTRVEQEGRIPAGPPEAAAPVPPRSKSDPTQMMVSSRTKEAVASIDGSAPSDVPLLSDVTPGKHAVRVEAKGYFPETVEGLAVDGRLVVVEVNLRDKPARVSLSGPEGSEVLLNGRPVGTVPLARPLDLSAGPHFLAVTRRGSYPFTRELMLDRGDEVSIDVSLEGTTQRTIAYWVLGGAGAVLLSGAIASGLALDAQSAARRREAEIQKKLDRGMNASTGDLTLYDDQVKRRDRFVTASGVFYASGLAIGVIGALLYFVDNPRVEQPIPQSAPAADPPQIRGVPRAAGTQPVSVLLSYDRIQGVWCTSF